MNAQLSTHLFGEELYHYTTPVLVVLPRPWESYGDEEHTLLNKILTSVKLDLNAVQVIVQPAVNLQSLQIYSPGRVLIFGCETNEDISFYEEIAAQGFIVIRADDLNALDDQKKKNLWTALRQMFRVNTPI